MCACAGACVCACARARARARARVRTRVRVRARACAYVIIIHIMTLRSSSMLRLLTGFQLSHRITSKCIYRPTFFAGISLVD